MAASIGPPRRNGNVTEYDVSIFGKTIHTTVMPIHDGITTWINDVIERNNLPRLVVGFDVLPIPYRTQTGINISSIQLCVGSHCIINQLYLGFIPRSLVDFLRNPYNVFVGVDIGRKLDMLETDFRMGGNASFVDVRALAAVHCNRPELRFAGLRELANVVLEKDYEKPVEARMIEWYIPSVTPEQVLYASIDPIVSYEIGTVLGAADFVI